MQRVSSTSLFHRRIPNLLRPLRPPNSPHPSSPTLPPTSQHLRLFTRNSQLLLVGGRLASRPQLPFLHQSSAGTSGGASVARLVHPSSRTLVHRFLTTERKQRWKRQFWQYLRFHLYFWPALALGFISSSGIEQTKLEHDYPTPREWSFWSRWDLRTAMDVESEEKRQRGLVDWTRAGGYYVELLGRLESEDCDGKSLIRQGDGGILVEGLGETGFDVSMKSEEWRRGYWQCLMGSGRVSERLDGMVKRKEGGKEVVDKDCVVGGGMERPKPMPWGMGESWTLDEVEDAFPSPERFYLKILTTKGLTSGQKVEAALAYADWCDFKGMVGTAENVLDWGMDIALAGLASTGKDAQGLVNKKTGVIESKRVADVSLNILKTCTAMGVHFAQRGEVKRALPIFLSVLKARKDLPPEPDYVRRAELVEKKKNSNDSGLWPYVIALRDWLVEAPYPRHPPSGDETPVHSLKEACEEVGLMAYIGEILYATSSREKGLSWTRDAVDAAEAVMWVMKEEDREDGRAKCIECLKTGLQNWRNMARDLVKDAKAKQQALLAEAKDKKWYDFGSHEKQAQAALQELKKWKEEEMQIDLRRDKTMPLLTPLRPVPTGLFTV